MLVELALRSVGRFRGHYDCSAGLVSGAVLG